MRLYIGLTILCIGALSIRAQDIEPKYKTADTNSAVIRGRVSLPSGFAAENYFRVTLKNIQSTLTTVFTNRSGEFQLRNLSEGTYYVLVESPDNAYDAMTKKVELGRGLFVDLNFELQENKALAAKRFASRVVSAAELRQVVPTAAKKKYETGLKLVSKNDFVHAAQSFEEALSMYPEYIAARNDLGAQFLKLHQLDNAEKHFLIVLCSDPKNFNAKFNMGLVHIERHDYVTGITALNEAISIDSSRPVARLWIGIAKLEMGNLPEAEAELTRSLIMGGNECVAAHYHLARLYMLRGDLAEAAQSVKAYLQQAPRGENAKEAKELERRIEQAKK